MKSVLITGANRGIGFETAKQMAALGYFVYLGSRDKEKGENAVQHLNEMGYSNTAFLQLDISDSASIEGARIELEGKIGALDVLINNAGILGDMPQDPSTTSIENYRKVFQTNVFGTIEVTQQFLGLLKKSDAPIIVYVSSEVGSLSDNADPNWFKYDAVKPFFAVYGASKSTINAFTIALAYELRNTKFKINSVTPGHTATEFNNYKGTKTVEEGAKPIVRFATLPDDGVSGKFYGEEGEINW
ncbi:SDR family oxidoreductase [Chryseobacterium sp.]|jgi:NAD(P)-dependent dehydrogenase (short-subunit alcohol dehydrogenase family)|uniref:SDR family oxidoreductase n=1 Tax=Chryseobacterium sp. TaxID=1871047 RepID=UPI00283CD8C8|nr:SDR family oxidoreductase [Chryseobacterium sp.]MDR3025019.1 SDR family oxidoreductase [Chryseobacterium sp.]